jgi:hypothetical protein
MGLSPSILIPMSLSVFAMAWATYIKFVSGQYKQGRERCCAILNVMKKDRLVPIFVWIAFLVGPVSSQAQLAPKLKIRQAHLLQTIEILEFEQDGMPIVGARAAYVRGPGGQVLRFRQELPKNSALGPHPRPTSGQIETWVKTLGVLTTGSPVHVWLATDTRLIPSVRVETPWTVGSFPMALVFDARTGVLLMAEPLLRTGAPLANVFPENPATTPQTHVEELEYLEPGSLILQGTYARVTSCVDHEECAQSQPLALRAHADEDFFYEPDLRPFSFDDPFAEVNAYRNLTRINVFLRERFGWQGLFLGQTYIEARVGKGPWYNAAYYRGNKERPARIVFGQDSIDFAYDADTAAHEFGHAFNDTIWEHPFLRRDEFGLDLAPNGIEEALADFWAIALAQDPILDAYVLRSRHADNTVTCPDGEMAQGHMAARYIDGALWDASKRIGLEALSHVVYRGMALLPRTPSIRDFIETLCDTAEELVAHGEVALPGDSSKILQEEAHSRGLLSEGCARRLVPLLGGTANTRYAYGYGRAAFAGRDTPFGLQWQIEAMAGRPAFKLFFDWLYPSEVEPGFAVMLRRGQPVRIEWIPEEELEQDGPAYRAEADLILEGSPLEVDFPPSNEPPLLEGEFVFVQLATRTEERTIAMAVTMQPTYEQAPYPTSHLPTSKPPPEPLSISARSGCGAAPGRAMFSPWLAVYSMRH